MTDWRQARFLSGDGGLAVILNVKPIKQEYSYDCGLVGLRMALGYHGIKPNPDYMPLADPQNGVPPDQLEASLRWHGLGVLAGNMTVNDLRDQCRAYRPVLCPISEGGGHWVVVQGVERGFVHFVDPDGGEYRKMKAKEFFALWWDFTRSGTVYHSFGIAAWRLDG